MGMRWRSYYITAGSGTGQLPVGNTDALRQTRSEMLLTACGQLLLDCNVGWQVDTSKCSSLTDYVAIPTASGNKTYPGLFFTNSISGCKLFMAYFGDEIHYNGIKDFSGNDLLKFYNYTYHGGICISIIPEDSQNTFGDPTTTTFIPSDATRICGTFYRRTFNYSTINYAAAYNPTDGRNYVYWIGATPYTVIIYVNHYDGAVPGLYIPVYATGKIFGDLAHTYNSESQKYGTVCFRNLSGDDESWALPLFSSIANPIGTANGIKVPGYSAFTTNTWSNLDTCGAFTNSSGGWINGNNGSNRSTILFTVGVEPIIKKAFDTTGGSTRWVPLAMMVLANDLSTYGVVSGDGFKGYLDTSLFRCAVATRGQTFNDNSFICLENEYSLLVGWDSSNPPIM